MAAQDSVDFTKFQMSRKNMQNEENFFSKKKGEELTKLLKNSPL